MKKISFWIKKLTILSLSFIFLGQMNGSIVEQYIATKVKPKGCTLRSYKNVDVLMVPCTEQTSGLQCGIFAITNALIKGKYGQLHGFLKQLKSDEFKPVFKDISNAAKEIGVTKSDQNISNITIKRIVNNSFRTDKGIKHLDYLKEYFSKKHSFGRGNALNQDWTSQSNYAPIVLSFPTRDKQGGFPKDAENIKEILFSDLQNSYKVSGNSPKITFRYAGQEIFILNTDPHGYHWIAIAVEKMQNGRIGIVVMDSFNNSKYLKNQEYFEAIGEIFLNLNRYEIDALTQNKKTYVGCADIQEKIERKIIQDIKDEIKQILQKVYITVTEHDKIRKLSKELKQHEKELKELSKK
jgi:hypothetical protein